MHVQGDNDDYRTDPLLSQHELQPRPGVYNETLFRALDSVLAEAAKNKIYVILALDSNWQVVDGTVQVRLQPDQSAVRTRYRVTRKLGAGFHSTLHACSA